MRREEVAELAGVSIDYIIRLEQGRGLRPSADVLEALARALRLNSDERAYLFDLAKQRPRRGTKPATTPGEALTQLVSDLSPLPAMLTNHRYDILAWNPQMARLLVDFGELPPAQRNLVWVCLMHPQLRDVYVDRDRIVRDGIAHLRAAWAAHPDDQVLTDLIVELTRSHGEFARLWATRDVKTNGRGDKVLLHPEVGELTMRFELFTPLQDPDQRLLICRATDADSRLALDRLSAE